MLPYKNTYLKPNLSLGPKEVNSGCTNGIEILWRKRKLVKY